MGSDEWCGMRTEARQCFGVELDTKLLIIHKWKPQIRTHPLEGGIEAIMDEELEFAGQYSLCVNYIGLLATGIWWSLCFVWHSGQSQYNYWPSVASNFNLVLGGNQSSGNARSFLSFSCSVIRFDVEFWDHKWLNNNAHQKLIHSSQKYPSP